jgi:RNA polymerase sigma-70 factor, ECF subfamily
MSFPLWFGESPDAVDRDGDISSGSAELRRDPANNTLESAGNFSGGETLDQALFARIKSGDDQALATLFRRYVQSLDRVALGVLGSRDQAHDAVQTVFVRLWNRRTDIAVPASVSAYLHRAVYNAARDAVRDASREARRRVFSVGPSATGHQEPAADEPLLQDELIGAVRTAIATLPGRSGEIFRLWWSGTMTYAQIAELMGMSVKGVEQARGRAVVQLRKALRGFWP